MSIFNAVEFFFADDLVGEEVCKNDVNTSSWNCSRTATIVTSGVISCTAQHGNSAPTICNMCDKDGILKITISKSETQTTACLQVHS